MPKNNLFVRKCHVQNVLDLLRYWKDHGEAGQQDAVRGLMVAVVAALRVEEEDVGMGGALDCTREEVASYEVE